GLHYRRFMRVITSAIAPKSYLEVGTNAGQSLAQIRCASISVDPRFALTANIMAGKPECHLFQMTSDEFFEKDRVTQIFPKGIDLAFLDGMHLFEYLLRDFIGAERYCSSRSVVALHDCLPPQAVWAERKPQTVGWTGDVWKVVLAIREFRPDIRITCLDCPPTGLVLCTGLDSSSTILRDNYETVLDRFSSMHLSPDMHELYGAIEITSTDSLKSREAILNKIFSSQGANGRINDAS
ncbi:class I SAM-dependent methyltransferase, partial [Hansschlegelia zhihuaiae]|uniref:class I SAM-dependent methyltransferase n=1 Tax=Hansschlegelia zhihuaiae TaxID=405005 RepID=UPI0019D4942A